MRVAVRADATVRLGTGHLMRCLALAEALAELAAEVHFFCAEEAGLAPRIEGSGFSLHRLDSAAVDSMRSALAETGPWDWLVVDHYDLDARAHRAWRDTVSRIAVIDDLADRDHDCDLLIDQNVNAAEDGRYTDRVAAHTRCLLGPRYALLRPAFAAARSAPAVAARRAGKSTRGEHGRAVDRVLVSLGGSDPDNLLGAILDTLTSAIPPTVRLDILAGAANPHYDALSARCAARENWHLLRHTDDPAALMAAADIAIGAGGGTTWERCCLALPSIVISIAENQRANAERLAAAGCQIYLGDGASLDRDQLHWALSLLLANHGVRQHLATAAGALVDGLGAQRCAQAMHGELVAFRPATPADCEPMLAWRNAPETRRFALDSKELAPGDHRAWFRSALEDPDRVLLIAELADEPVGVLRFDLQGDAATVSIYLVPGQQGRGLGVSLLRTGERWLHQHHPGIGTLRADVLEANRASLAAFARAGYRTRQRGLEKRIAPAGDRPASAQ